MYRGTVESERDEYKIPINMGPAKYLELMGEQKHGRRNGGGKEERPWPP